MRTEVVMPQMGESVAEGTVTAWLKEIGDHVERDEPLFEITTDKVDAEVPSPVAGKLVEWLVEPGSTIPINAVVAIVDAEGDAPEAGAEPPEVNPLADPAPEARAQSSAPAPAPAPSAPSTSRSAPGAPVGAQDASAAELQRTRSTPLVRRIAADHGISDLSGVPASGRNGRVTKRDILGFIDEGGEQAPAPQRAQAPAPQRAPAAHKPLTLGDRDTTEPLSPQRMSIARHMLDSLATSAHAHTVHEIDFTAVFAARKALKGQFQERGVKLTYTAFMVSALGQALAEFPMLNSSLDGDQVIHRGDINVGVAVALDASLIVPVVRNVDEMSLLGIARQINDMSTRARTKRLKPDEVRGGTFTLSNHGIFGPEFGIPIINQPQVAIISTGAIKKRVVVDQRTDAIMVRPTAIFCMSFDHRVVDGATADKFLARMREIIEGWSV